MILDYRIYATIYTTLCLAWIAAFPMVQLCRHETTSRYMVIVAGTFSIVAALNFIDWLWA